MIRVEKQWCNLENKSLCEFADIVFAISVPGLSSVYMHGVVTVEQWLDSTN